MASLPRLPRIAAEPELQGSLMETFELRRSGRRLSITLVGRDNAQLDVNAWAPAPIIGSDDHGITADDAWVMRVDLISNRPVDAGLGPEHGLRRHEQQQHQRRHAELSGWDAASGALLANQPLVDTVTGREFAFDVCTAASCGGRRAMTVAWICEFKGPSGTSPLPTAGPEGARRRR